MSCVGVESHDKDNFHVYLCIGQSNMYGSTDIEVQDSLIPLRYKMIASTQSTKRNLGEWYDAFPPLFNAYSGLSPADYFGRTMARHMENDITVALVPVAVPGSDIRLFDKDLYLDYLEDHEGENWYHNILNDYGCNPYQRLIFLTKEAQKCGVIKGIILHQGERNTGDNAWPEYVKRVYENILADLSLKAEDVPLIAGEVAHADYNGTCAAMNKIIDELPRTIRTAYVVSSQGCPVKDDHTHFNSEGVRTLGRRYAEKMLEVKGFKK